MKHFGTSVSSTNRQGLKVEVGQRWRSMDKRRPERSCEVVSVACGVATLQEFERDRASIGLMAAIKSSDPKTAAYAAAWKPEPVRVRIDRMHEHSTGWRLLSS